MAWFQNLAGKAEDFLNKIDQNAANVLNDPTSTIVHSSSSPDLEAQSNSFSSRSIQHVESTAKVNVRDDVSVTSAKSEDKEGGIYIDFSPTILQNDLALEGIVSEQLQRDDSSLSSKSPPPCNSFNYEDDLTKLESENQSLNERLLNLQHLYSEVWNENVNLRTQIERANESVTLAQNEMEQYKARAQRILHEKEKLILLQSDDDVRHKLPPDSCNDELKKESEFLHERNRELLEKITALNKELTVLQQQYVFAQNNNKTTVQNLQESIENEKRFRTIAEEECRVKTKELQSALLELSQQQINFKGKVLELQQVKNQLKIQAGYKTNHDAESRLQTLTETLMAKQNTLETITTERNALKIQMEKLENQYQMLLMQNQRNEVVISNINDTDDAKSQVPKLMIMSPFDAGVTRRVKHAYSTLDAVSIRTGVFLRRYPLARIFVFCYMILLHVWMLIILYMYVP